MAVLQLEVGMLGGHAPTAYSIQHLVLWLATFTMVSHVIAEVAATDNKKQAAKNRRQRTDGKEHEAKSRLQKVDTKEQIAKRRQG